MYSAYLNGIKGKSYAGGSDINFEKNLSPVPIIWLNNEKVFGVGGNMFSIYCYSLNISTGEEETIRNTEEPFIENRYYNSSYNEKLNKIAIMLDYGNRISTYIYDLSKKTWKYVNKFEVPSYDYTCNCGWDLDDNLYFDTAIGKEQEIKDNTIKKYDIKTGKVEDYLNNARILNFSPDGRYMAYIDTAKQNTQIKDLRNDRNITITLTKELEWNPEKDEFAFIDTLRKSIYVITIGPETLKIKKYKVDKIIEDGTELINLQYYDGKIRFDSAKYITVDQEIAGIEKVLTFEIS